MIGWLRPGLQAFSTEVVGRFFGCSVAILVFRSQLSAAGLKHCKSFLQKYLVGFWVAMLLVFSSEANFWLLAILVNALIHYYA